MKLTLKDQTSLCKKFEKNGFVPYLETIRFININHDTGDWSYQKQLKITMPKAEKLPTFYKSLKSPREQKFHTITDYAEISDKLSQTHGRNQRLINRTQLQSLS